MKGGRTSSTSRSSTQSADAQRLRFPRRTRHRLLRFGDHYRQIAQPFAWTFTRTDLDAVLAKLTEHEPKLTLAF
jgi:hypothetical protein